MNVNLISFSQFQPIINVNFYPDEVMVGSSPLIVFNNEDYPINIKYTEIINELIPLISDPELSTFNKSNLWLM